MPNRPGFDLGSKAVHNFRNQAHASSEAVRNLRIQSLAFWRASVFHAQTEVVLPKVQVMSSGIEDTLYRLHPLTVGIIHEAMLQEGYLTTLAQRIRAIFCTMSVSPLSKSAAYSLMMIRAHCNITEASLVYQMHRVDTQIKLMLYQRG